VYIADTNNLRIRRLGPFGTITTVVGTGQSGSSPDGTAATSASIYPRTVAVHDGVLYFSDDGVRVRAVVAGALITVAGGQGNGSVGDGGPAVNAAIYVSSIGFDATGRLLLVDKQRVSRVEAGMITTIAGNGTPGLFGDGGSATEAQLAGPSERCPDQCRSLARRSPTRPAASRSMSR